MKKYVFLIVFTFFCLFIQAQSYFNLDIKKLNKAFSGQEIAGFKLADTLSIYGGIIGSYKDANGNEMVISFDSLSRFKKMPSAEKSKTTPFTKGKTKMIFFESDYITALYAELPEYNLVLSLTSYVMSRESLEKIYDEMKPEEKMKSALIK
jgi:hypothetical protein